MSLTTGQDDLDIKLDWRLGGSGLGFVDLTLREPVLVMLTTDCCDPMLVPELLLVLSLLLPLSSLSMVLDDKEGVGGRFS